MLAGALHSPTVAWVPDVAGSGFSPSTLGTEKVAPAHILYEPLATCMRQCGGGKDREIYTIMFLHFCPSLF